MTRMIKSGAENIFPAEVENCLEAHPAVKEAAVIGIPSERFLQDVKAVVVLNGTVPATAADLVEHCRRHIASYKKPKTVEFLDALPRLRFSHRFGRESSIVCERRDDGLRQFAPILIDGANLYARHRGPGESARATLPMFLVGFAVLVVVNSIGLLPKVAIDLANDVSRWCLVAAIAALGMKTSFKALFAVGWRPIGLMVAETLWIAVLVLFSVKMII